jgi:indole-3-glycerol phosphate synthase
MSNTLDEIVAHKKIEVAEKKIEFPFDELVEKSLQCDETRDFTIALRTHEPDEIGCIAEIKKASPSKGLITKDFNVEKIAHDYYHGGAKAISVLTDVKYFRGSNDNLRIAKKTVPIPILRKDFIVDEYQIYESRLIGADAILLIVAILTDDQIRSYLATALDLSLSVLVESHTKEEIDRAVDCGAEIIGINNRDLKNFQVSIETSLNLKRFIPNHCISVSESGIRNNHLVRQLGEAGFDAVLVGEQLMVQADRKKALRDLFGSSAIKK